MNFLLVLHTLIVLGLMLRILLRDDLSPPARLAWFVVIAVGPLVGSLAYFLFGEVYLSRKARATQVTILERLRPIVGAQMGCTRNMEQKIAVQYQPVFSYGASINGFHTTDGNTAELMADGDDTLTRMLADIDAASDQVHVLYYIWLNDHTGTALAEALIRAAGRGVTCRAMADGLGSRAMIASKLWQRMQAAGVQTAVALPLNRPLHTILTSRLDLRNHRKITVIDGAITYCGSRNSADPEFLPKAEYGPWVDIMLRFQGPVVAQNQLLFISDWMRATGQAPSEPLRVCPPIPGGFAAQVTGHGPTERRGSTPQLFSLAMGCARRSLTITTPYFVPDATVLEALCATAHRGVKVTLILPQRNDSWVVAAVSHSYYRRLLEAGCIIHEFKDGLLHAKTLTVDDHISLIGSSNLDLRSFDLNYENNILFQDAAMTQQICQRQANYIARSVQVTLTDVAAWSYFRRIWNNVIATIGPIL